MTDQTPGSQARFGGWTAVWTACFVAATVAVMVVVADTPLAAANDYLFAVPIVGVLVYGALLSAGHRYTERFLEQGAYAKAAGGATLLGGTYATFGSGILTHLSMAARLEASQTTFFVAALIAALITAYVYCRPAKTFERWRDRGKQFFVVGIIAALVGSPFTPVLILAFAAITLGFVLMFGWETAHVRDEAHDRPVTAAVGTYVAFMGVFVQILQLVVHDS